MNLASREVKGFLRNDSVVSTLKCFLAAAVKGTVAFSGGKLGGGVSSKS